MNVQDVMFEIFEYARISDGINNTKGTARRYQLDEMEAQDQKLRQMLEDLITTVPESAPVHPEAAAVEPAQALSKLYDMGLEDGGDPQNELYAEQRKAIAVNTALSALATMAAEPVEEKNG
jgi:hypothetical protein